MSRWKLLVTTVPFVIVILAVALLRDALKIPGVVEFGDIAAITTAVALIIGFMYAGVSADYKESERLPGELAACLETLLDAAISTDILSDEPEAKPLRARVVALARVVEAWLLRHTSVAECYAALQTFNEYYIPRVHRFAGMTPATRAQGEIHNLRRAITRVDVLRRTSFIQSGYALLDVMVGAAVVLLLAANYKNVWVEYLIVGFLSFVYLYLIRLIRDLDNPFDYAITGHHPGSTEVDPFPIIEFCQRAEKAEGSGQKAEGSQP
jgi:hypothetical protein